MTLIAQRVAMQQRMKDAETIIGLTCGAFDILHINHINFLREAKLRCDFLMVSVNRDASVRELKGPGRPINPEGERVEVVAAFKSVDFAFLFDELDPCEVIKSVRPDVFFKGRDRRPEDMPETPLLDKLCIRLELVGPPKDHSTTAIIEKLGLRPDSHETAKVPQAPLLPAGF